MLPGSEGGCPLEPRGIGQRAVQAAARRLPYDLGVDFGRVLGCDRLPLGPFIRRAEAAFRLSDVRVADFLKILRKVLI